jgi:diguanylate cyclase (GGDEF)-like protein
VAYLGYSVLVGTGHPLPKAVVVVADDDRAMCERIARLLREHGLTVISAPNAQGAIDAVRARPIDLVLMDVTMPGLSGVDACKVIKTITKDQFLPVNLMTTPGDGGSRLQHARTVSDEIVAKPVSDSELVARVENMLRVKRAHDDVQFAKKEMHYTSLHDQLRELPDHRQFHETLEREFGEAERHLDPLACCIVAVDEFRPLVAEHGADVAARVLEEVSARLRRTIRATDVAAQFRTAEFGLLLPNTRPATALTLADRLVHEVAMRPIEIGRSTITITIAIGIGLYPSGRIRTHSELLDAASIAVARARVAGPNRICVVQRQGYIFRPKVPGAA